MIIFDDNFSRIITVANWGRSVFINIEKFVQFQQTVNVVSLIVNFSSTCFRGNLDIIVLVFQCNYIFSICFHACFLAHLLNNLMGYEFCGGNVLLFIKQPD